MIRILLSQHLRWQILPKGPNFSYQRCAGLNAPYCTPSFTNEWKLHRIVEVVVQSLYLILLKRLMNKWRMFSLRDMKPPQSVKIVAPSSDIGVFHGSQTDAKHLTTWASWLHFWLPCCGSEKNNYDFSVGVEVFARLQKQDTSTVLHQ